MSTIKQTQPEDGFLHRPDEYHAYADKLNPGNNLFQCNKCGHYAGDPRSGNFRAQCPDCDRVVKFYRIIE